VWKQRPRPIGRAFRMPNMALAAKAALPPVAAPHQQEQSLRENRIVWFR
jgi:hypothetical protein